MIITRAQIRKLQRLLGIGVKPEHKETPPKKSPSHTKKGPGRIHAGSPRRKIRGYIKHYDRNHSS